MTRTAQEVLADAVRKPTPRAGANRLVPAIAAGRAPREVIATLALEQHHIITSDFRSYGRLCERSAGQPGIAAFFRPLAHGESLALERLAALITACGLDEAAVRAYEPRAGCQAYPAYTAWLALGAEPVDAVVAITANFAAWSGYCATVGRALRVHYGLDDEACGFFDLFAAPDPRGAERAAAAVADGLAAGLLSERLAHRYGRLLQDYELMFWNTLAEE